MGSRPCCLQPLPHCCSGGSSEFGCEGSALHKGEDCPHHERLSHCVAMAAGVTGRLRGDGRVG